jgi:hypothetical protein
MAEPGDVHARPALGRGSHPLRREAVDARLSQQAARVAPDLRAVASVAALVGPRRAQGPLPARGELRLTRRGRRLVAASAVAVALATVVVLVGSLPPYESTSPVQATTTVRVAGGDTAWSLAERLRPRVDPRTTVEEMVRLNGLSTVAQLRPGSVVVVPVDGGPPDQRSTLARAAGA